MEKFAVDLDKVLDEFEFNEDCAEQVALSRDCENLWIPPQLRPCSSDSPVFVQPVSGGSVTLMSEDGNAFLASNKELRCSDDQVPTEDSVTKATTSNLEDKGELEHSGSIDDFYNPASQINGKIQREQYVNFREGEPTSVTIHHDKSQIFVQKKQSNCPPIGTNSRNSYDKKFNQVNIKPSVSNVFSSLNDYINAPSGNMKQIDGAGLHSEATNVKVPSQINEKIIGDDSNQVGPAVTSELISGQSVASENHEPQWSGLPICPTVVNQNIVSSVDSDPNVWSKVQNLRRSTDQEGMMAEHSSINVKPEETSRTVPIVSQHPTVAHSTKDSQALILHASSELNVPLVPTGIENVGGPLISIAQRESKLIYGNVCTLAEGRDICDMPSIIMSNNGQISKSLEYKESRQVDEAAKFDQTLEGTDTGNRTCPNIHVGKVENSTTTEKKPNSEASVHNSHVVASRSQEQTANAPLTEKEHVIGFNMTIDLSKDELNEYLAELEKQDRAMERNVIDGIVGSMHDSPPEDDISRRVLPTMRKQQTTENEDTNEGPNPGTVMIDTLPIISETTLQEKAENFCVIDYSMQRGLSNETDAGSTHFRGEEGSQEIAERTVCSYVPGSMKEHCGKTENRNSVSRIEINTNKVERRTIEEDTEYIDPWVTKGNALGKSNSVSESVDNPSQNFHTHSIPANESPKNLGLDVIRFEGNNAEDVDAEIEEKGLVSDGTAQYGNSLICSEAPKRDCTTEGCKRSDNCICNEQNMNPNTSEYCSNSNDGHGLSALTTSPGNVFGESVEASELERSGIEDKHSRPQTLDVSTVNMAEDITGGHVTLEVDSDTSQHRDCSQETPQHCSFESSTILGRQPPFWIPDNEAPNCMLCDAKFTVIKRRHHCRACGKVLCSKCCSMRFRLHYQVNIDSRVCSPCYQLLVKVEQQDGDGDCSSGCPSSSPGDINPFQERQPNPNNPMEYCSTIPPLQQLAGGLPTPPTVMVPVGVLKREGSFKQRSEGQKSVMFSDGIRPGCDLTELDTSWDLKPPYRKMGKRIPGQIPAGGPIRRQNIPSMDPVTNCYIPQDPDILPPTVTVHRGEISYHEAIGSTLLYESLKSECDPPLMFAINRNLYAYVKLINLHCCVNRVCWNVTSRGLACVGQDEIILLVETLPDETQIPKDLFVHINQIYNEAIKGNTISELGVSIHQGGQFLGSREHGGFLFIRQTFQCLQKIIIPPAPFLIGLLIHRWETPWAKVFPLRLMLRLGAEYRYYPCPLVSVRFRDAVYFEIGHTIMKVLADFRNYTYTVPGVRGLTIHMQDRTTEVLIPKNRYDQVIKGLNNSNDHVLAFAANFSIEADSHLVCIQTNTGDESSYQTQAINIHNKPRKVTGASFVVINGALKSSMGLSAKSSIVEDGLMVQIMPEKMEALKASLKNMQDFSIGCGYQGAQEPDENVIIKWVDNDVQFNLGVKSPIDGKPMDGIPSIRVHNGTDYVGTNRFIRWTEVFIMKAVDHPAGLHDPVDINKLSESIARATCAAFVKLLDLLASAGLTKLAVRATIHPDNVGYEAGSEGTRLPPIYMNSLDNELVQVLHKAAEISQDTNTILELVFHVLNE